MPPQSPIKTDVSQVSIVTQKTPALKRFKRFAQHEPLCGNVVQFVHRLAPCPRALNDETSGPALLIEPPESLNYLGQNRSSIVGNSVQEGQQHYWFVRHCHVHFADELQESIANRVIFDLGRANGLTNLVNAVALKIEVGSIAKLQSVVGVDKSAFDRPSYAPFASASAGVRGTVR